MIKSVTFDILGNKLIIELKDGSTKEYTTNDIEQYKSDYPDREADLKSIGWIGDDSVAQDLV